MKVHAHLCEYKSMAKDGIKFRLKTLFLSVSFVDAFISLQSYDLTSRWVFDILLSVRKPVKHSGLILCSTGLCSFLQL